MRKARFELIADYTFMFSVAIALFLASMVIFLSLLTFSAGAELVVVEYEKNYYILNGNEQLFTFKAYRSDNTTVLLSFSYPTSNAVYLSNGTCRSFTTESAYFDICLAEVKDSYAVLELDVMAGDIKIADPETVVMAVPQEPQEAETNLTAEIQALSDQIADLKMEIVHLNDTVYAYASEVEELKTNGVSANGSVDLTPLSQRMDQIEARLSKLESKTSNVDVSKLAKLESKVSSLETQLNVLSKMVANLSKERQSQSLQMLMDQFAEKDPKMALLLIALDNSIPESQKSTLMAQLIAKQKEREQEAQFKFMILLLILAAGSIGGILLWMRRRGANPYSQF